MIKSFFSFARTQSNLNEIKVNPADDELNNLNSDLNYFQKLVRKYPAKNEILKKYDSLDLKLIEFINSYGRNSKKGQEAVQLSRRLSRTYNYFKTNIHLYLDETNDSKKQNEILKPIIEIKKTTDFDETFVDLKSRLNKFKTEVMNNEMNFHDAEICFQLFNDELNTLIINSSERYKNILIELRARLIYFYEYTKKNHEKNLIKESYHEDLKDVSSRLNNFKSKAENVKNLILNHRENNHEDVNNRLSELKNHFNEIEASIHTRFIKREKNYLLKNLYEVYNNLNSFHSNYLEKDARKTSLPLFNIMKSYIYKDMRIIENQRLLLRDVISNTYSQVFSFNKSLFSTKSKNSLKKLEKAFNMEVQRNLVLEDLNDRIIPLGIERNKSLKPLINEVISLKRPFQNADLKDTIMEICGDIVKNDKDSLNKAIVKLTEITNNVLPSRKRALYELKNKIT
ncbi:hypothetical protein HYX16_04595 [Candidatus Woesearchaeota archaeon]|nr:hypothetical protein [Candidatus Woesearchaeota archaeon]